MKKKNKKKNNFKSSSSFFLNGKIIFSLFINRIIEGLSLAASGNAKLTLRYFIHYISKYYNNNLNYGFENFRKIHFLFLLIFIQISLSLFKKIFIRFFGIYQSDSSDLVLLDIFYSHLDNNIYYCSLFIPRAY